MLVLFFAGNAGKLPSEEALCQNALYEIDFLSLVDSQVGIEMR